MDKEFIEKEFQKIIKNFNEFLTTKDLLIFTFFLFLSASLWVLHALRGKYETMVKVPIEYVGLPNGYVVTQDLPNTLHLTIVGQGTNLVKYKFGYTFTPLEIDMSNMTKGKQTIHTKNLTGKLQKQIKSEVSISKIFPDTITVTIEKQSSKKLPVIIDGTFDLAQQYTYCDSIQVEPNIVTAYGSKINLEDLTNAVSEKIVQSNIKDTLKLDVKLKSIPHIIFSDSIIHLTFMTERFTEKTVQAPISITHLPKDRNLRIFPSSVSANFRVGLSNYEKIDASSFAFVVDYNDAKGGNNKKISVNIKDAPKEVFGIKLTPEAVDFIIEEKITE
ncbi:MAG: CdaR family protein [Paludibacteraceae bacterium]|nr:CdaR family protein [Paludibacteraceae bacterium]